MPPWNPYIDIASGSVLVRQGRRGVSSSSPHVYTFSVLCTLFHVFIFFWAASLLSRVVGFWWRKATQQRTEGLVS